MYGIESGKVENRWKNEKDGFQFKDDQVILEAYGKQAKRGGSTLFKLLDQLRWIKSQSMIFVLKKLTFTEF